jgi:hypothetical protein
MTGLLAVNVTGLPPKDHTSFAELFENSALKMKGGTANSRLPRRGGTASFNFLVRG